MGLLDASYSAVNTKKPRKSDRILPATELNARGLLDAATNVPIAGDALSGVLAAYDAAKGDYGSAAMNALGVLPFVSGTFIGKGAKTWDKVKEADAMSRLAKGEDAAKVWKETGYGKAPWDKAARSEIDDSKARLRDYFYTPQEAYKNAAERALINDSGRDQVRAMLPYKDKSVSQLKDEYKRTGGEIVDAAMSGNKELAMQLSENRSGLDGILSAMRDRKYGPMSNYMAHGDLGQAYPDVYKMHTRIDSDLGGANGQYLRGSDTQGEQIVIGQKPQWKEDKSVALHELQHAIQQREGWAGGGSAEMFKTGLIPDSQVIEQAKALGKWVNEYGGDVEKYAKGRIPPYLGDEWQDAAIYLAKNPSELAKKSEILQNFNDPKGAYKRLAGEAEARLTQARMNLSPEQRLAQYPYDPEYFKQATGVDINNLIVRGDGGKAMSLLDDVRPMTEYEKRHEIARQNAVKMLGLPENNTAMDRAKAMGAVDAYHGTASDVQQLDPKMFGSSTGAESAKRAWWAVDEPSTARGYAEYAANQAPVKRLLDQADKLEKKGDWDGYDRVLGEAEALEASFANNPLNGQNIMPLKIIPQNPKIMDAGGAEFTDLEGGVNNFLRQAKFGKNDVAIIKNLSDDVGFNGRPATHYGVLNPAAVRSRFAAFDPARINEPDMMGYADPRLLGLIGGGGLLGLGAYKANQE